MNEMKKYLVITAIAQGKEKKRSDTETENWKIFYLCLKSDFT
ncbi:hypothetical protein SMIB22_16410 [Streptococcus mitis]